MENSGFRGILLVDDDDVCRITTKWFLNNFGYAVETARSAEQALSLFDPQNHDVVITDNSMSGMNGTELAHIIKLRSPSTAVIMYTGSPPTDESCLNVILKRPTHLLVLKDAVEKVLTASLSDSLPVPAS